VAIAKKLEVLTPQDLAEWTQSSDPGMRGANGRGEKVLEPRATGRSPGLPGTLLAPPGLFGKASLSLAAGKTDDPTLAVADLSHL